MIDKEYGIKTGKWGPYNKEFLGVCHIADEHKGATFNVEFFPGIQRQTIMCDPINAVDAGVKMWGANSNLTYFVYRYELEWKDKVYCDIAFNIKDDKNISVQCNFVNNSDFEQSLSLDVCFSLNYPTDYYYYDIVGYKKINEYFIDDSMLYVDAVDYDSISISPKIAEDGFYLGEAFVSNSTNKGTAISEKFFGSCDTDFLSYKFQPIKADSIGIRYKSLQDAQVIVEVFGHKHFIKLNKSENYSYFVLNIEKDIIDQVKIYSNGNSITLDCIIVGENVESARFEPFDYDVDALISNLDSGVQIKYKNILHPYYISWDTEPTMQRKYYTDNLSVSLKKDIHNSLFKEIPSARQTFKIYENLHTDCISVAPRSNKIINYFISSDKPHNEYFSNCDNVFKISANAESEKYSFSQNMLAYNTLLNVVYPIYNRRNYIIHSTPGRLWNSLYQWDNGFIGLGLATIDFNRAYECLNTYLTPENDIHSPFIYSGTIMPTQVFLYDYLISNFDEKEKLEKLYPLMKSYYMFFSNLKNDSSQMKSGLLKCWHLVYNSGGWDDYPPQKALDNRFNCIENFDGACPENTTPVITTAVTILIAKILRKIAKLFNKKDDITIFDNDIDYFSKAIQENCYDESSGYFQYLVHDKNGNPKCFFKYDKETLYNSGFDGIYPYISNMTTDEQSLKIIDNIKNGLMTEYGVSVVDLRAPYYSSKGYWNGNIWFPHQWILWKSLLDHCESELATEIGFKALDVWKKEMDESYRSSENFSIETGRGCGFHQFSGLSTPPLLWYKAYFDEGTINTGFLTTIFNKKIDANLSSVTFDYIQETEESLILICLNENKFNFYVNDKKVDHVKANSCSFYFSISGKRGSVRITRS